MISDEVDGNSQNNQIVRRAIDIDRTSRWAALRLQHPPLGDDNAMQSWLADLISLSDEEMPMKDQEKVGNNDEKVKSMGQETPIQTSLPTKKRNLMPEAVSYHMISYHRLFGGMESS